MYDTPLTRPTTVGGLLGNVFRGTGQVAQAGGGVPIQNYVLGQRVLDMIAARNRPARNRTTGATTMVAPPQGYQSILGMPSMLTPIAPDAPASPTSGLGLLQDVPPPMPRPSLLSDQLNQIERQSTPAPSLLGRIGGGIRSAGKELGGLFEGEEGRARAAALSRSLLRGPSRTPISFGQSLTEGLAAGGEEIERMEQRKFTKEQRARQKKQIEAQNKLADVLADPEATDTEKKSAFKAAYPVEAFKSEGKSVDLVKQIGAIAIRKKQAELPLSKVEQDAYNKLMSSGDSGMFKELMDRGIISMPDAPESAQPRDTSVIPLPADRGASDRFNVEVVDKK